MITPFIHLNGSGRLNLAETYTKTRDLLYAALQEMTYNRPHMRDYYPLGNANEAYRLAVDEHNAREGLLSSVIHDYEVLIRAISNPIARFDKTIDTKGI